MLCELHDKNEKGINLFLGCYIVLWKIFLREKKWSKRGGNLLQLQIREKHLML